MPPVVTRSGSNARHGVYPNDNILTARAIRKRGVSRVATIQTGPDARGAEAQPLYFPNVLLPNGKQADLVVICTQGNVIHGYNLRTLSYIWEFTLDRPIKSVKALDVWGTNDNFGIMSTPVGDASKGLLWLCMWSSPDGTAAKARFYVCEIEVATGKVRRKLDLSSVSYDPGHGLSKLYFNSMPRKQRASLLLLDGMLYILFGTVAETSEGAHGWIVAVDTLSMTVLNARTTTARGSGAGGWMAGQGMSVGANGLIYFALGNGDFDGITDFGECVIEMKPLTLEFVGWYAVFSDDLRTGRTLADVIPADKNTAIAHTVSDPLEPDMPAMDMTGMNMNAEDMPTNYRKFDLRLTPSGAIEMGARADMDHGSGGAQPIDKHGIVLSAGKDGIAVLNRMGAMGNTTVADLRDGTTNYAKLAGPRIFFTYYPPGQNAAPKDINDLNYLFDGKTHHMHSTPVYIENTAFGDLVLCWGENSPLKCYRIIDAPYNGKLGKALEWIADGAEMASAWRTDPPGGMPGGMMCASVSAEGAVLWATVPYGDANMGDGGTGYTMGRLLAYDLSTMKNGKIEKIWDSQDWNWRFVFNKFCPPTLVVDHGYLLFNDGSGGVNIVG